MLALRGEVRVLGPTGERSLRIDDFLLDTFTTALKDDESDHQGLRPDPPAGQRRGISEA